MLPLATAVARLPAAGNGPSAPAAAVSSPLPGRRPAGSDGMSWSQVAGNAQQPFFSGLPLSQGADDEFSSLDLLLKQNDLPETMRQTGHCFDDAYRHALSSPLISAQVPTNTRDWQSDTGVFSSFAAPPGQSATTTPDAFGEAAAQVPLVSQHQSAFGALPPGLSSGTSPNVYPIGSPALSPWHPSEPCCVVITQPQQAVVPYSVQELHDSGRPIAQVCGTAPPFHTVLVPVSDL